MAALPARFGADRGGNVAIIVGVAAFVLAGIAGAGIDYARMLSTGNKLQDGADGAAIDAALTIAGNPQGAASQVETKAREFLQPALASTMETTGDATSVQIENAAPARVRVTVSQDQYLAFGRFFGVSQLKVTRSSTAVAGEAVPVCLLVLDPAAADAWTVQGTSDVIGRRCAAQVNSRSARALGSNGNARVNTLKTLVAGPPQTAAAWTPKPEFSQRPMADPFAGRLPWPKAGSACTYTLGALKNLSRSLTPGTICGGIELETGGRLKLSPGVYVVQSGGVKVRSGAVLDGGGGVTLVLTDPTATVEMQAGGSMILSSTRSGPWAGMALAIKPQPSELTSTLIGGGETALDGIVYAPSQRLRLTGGAAMDKADVPRQWVANRITTEGNGQVMLASGGGPLSLPAGVRLVK
ncbi:MAG TPA: pilus assembly protein TadG-related protein [Caulobacteraceae bacterium]|jgi:hypothetical protein